MEKEGPESVSIREVLLDMRNYRMGLIQTPDQLKFSYLAIAEGARQAGHISMNILSGRIESGKIHQANLVTYVALC